VANRIRIVDHETDPSETDAENPSRFSLKTLILALIAIEMIAIGIKVWDERQIENRSNLAILQREALAVSTFVEGEINTARTAINVAQRAGSSLSIAAEASGQGETILSLTRASQAEEKSNARAAAEVATSLIADGKTTGISSKGDIVIVQSSPGGQPVLAVVSAEAWMPKAQIGRAYRLIGKRGVVLGDSTLSRPLRATNSTQPRMVSNGFVSRAAVSCTNVGAGGLSLCAAQAIPLVSSAQLARILMYLLLLSGPALAIFGLFQALKDKNELEDVAENTKVESTKIIDMVMDGARAGYWEWRVGDNEAFVSSHMAKLLELPVGGVMSMENFLPSVHPVDQSTVQQAFDEASKTGMLQVAFRTFHSQGRRWLEMKGRIGETEPGERPLASGICTDLTERKLAEDRRRAAERRLRSAIDGFSGPFAIWDKRKRLLYWNSAFAHTFNLDGALRAGMGHDAVGMARAPAVRLERPSEDDIHTQIISLNSGPWLKMVERTTPEGGLITVGVDITDTMNSQEALTRQKGKLKRLVQELERSEGRAGELARKYGEEKAKAEHAAHTKSAFLANMSHELRTPLNAINGFSEILANELYGKLGDERYKGYAEDILASGQHLLDMINDILDMAKIEAGKMTVSLQRIDPVDPVDAAVRMIRRKAEEKDVELILEHDEEIPDIDADPRAMRQMVLNLVSNAVKFTDPGGKITVSMQLRRDELRIAVADTGVGIPEEDLPRLAQPFEQVNDTRDRNYEGTGLGLALTKSFAEMHGGRMMIASVLGEGTTVSFFLPVKATGEASGEMDIATMDVA